MGWARLDLRRLAGLRSQTAVRGAGFDDVVASEPGLARACDAGKASGLATLPAEGVLGTSGRAADVRHRAPPADGPHGASRHDVQMTVRDILSSYARGSVMRSSVSHFIGVAIDQCSPRGVRILEGKNMPCIPEGQPLAWCARASIRSERDCWEEAMKIVRMLVPGETVAVDLNCPRQKRRLSGTLLLSHAKAALLPRRAADIKMKRVVKRVVPVGGVSSDGWMEGGPSLLGMPHSPQVHRRGCHE